VHALEPRFVLQANSIADMQAILCSGTRQVPAVPARDEANAR
jgi:hypothetical protein